MRVSRDKSRQKMAAGMVMKWPDARSVDDSNDVTPPPSTALVAFVCALSLATCVIVAYAYFNG